MDPGPLGPGTRRDVDVEEYLLGRRAEGTVPDQVVLPGPTEVLGEPTGTAPQCRLIVEVHLVDGVGRPSTVRCRGWFRTEARPPRIHQVVRRHS